MSRFIIVFGMVFKMESERHGGIERRNVYLREVKVKPGNFVFDLSWRKKINKKALLFFSVCSTVYSFSNRQNDFLKCKLLQQVWVYLNWKKQHFLGSMKISNWIFQILLFSDPLKPDTIMTALSHEIYVTIVIRNIISDSKMGFQLQMVKQFV